TDETYDDFVEMDAKTFYERITKDPNDIPKTSYVSPGRMTEFFESLDKEGYEEAIVITISSKLSGLFEAVKRVGSEMKIKVTVFDSKTLAYGEAFMVLEAHKMASQGTSTKEIISHLEKIRDHNKVFFAVDTL